MAAKTSLAEIGSRRAHSRAVGSVIRPIVKKRGKFITLEGIDGTGKSTQLRSLVRYLKQNGVPVKVTHEPGGTRIGDRIRRILLSGKTSHLDALAELALFYAARAQHIQEVIRPALAAGEWVVSDRFSDASMAYQGYGRGLGRKTVESFEKVVCGGLKPDLTFVLEVDPHKSLHRARQREARRESTQDRFEAEAMAFHRRVQAGYRAIRRREPHRVKLIDASRSIAQIQEALRRGVAPLLSTPSTRRGARKTKA